MVDPVVGQRPLQRLGDVLLADHVGEGVRSIAPVQRQRGFRTLHRRRIGRRVTAGFEGFEDGVRGQVFRFWIGGGAEQVGAVHLVRCGFVEEAGLFRQLVLALVVHG